MLPSPVSVFMIRWLLFRFMFLSGLSISLIRFSCLLSPNIGISQKGAVKLLSQCPTWWNLTALHYHYETQCVPNAMAWFAHHLPDCIQRFHLTIIINAIWSVCIWGPEKGRRLKKEFCFPNTLVLFCAIKVICCSCLRGWTTLPILDTHS